MASHKPGTLYIIASPIGNMEDITLRALRILKEEAQYAYCEDTRQTAKLLRHYGISLPLQSLHAHSSDEKVLRAVNLLLDGTSIAYLTDSGTPGVSDPGGRLVHAAFEHHIPVIPVPGPSALTAIASVAGFPEKNILFAGFLSKKDGKKKREIEHLLEFDGILVIYESPYRIKKLITILNDLVPDASIVIGREISKLYEEIRRGSVREIYESLDSLIERGEFAIALYRGKKRD